MGSRHWRHKKDKYTFLQVLSATRNPQVRMPPPEHVHYVGYTGLGCPGLARLSG